MMQVMLVRGPRVVEVEVMLRVVLMWHTPACARHAWVGVFQAVLMGTACPTCEASSGSWAGVCHAGPAWPPGHTFSAPKWFVSPCKHTHRQAVHDGLWVEGREGGVSEQAVLAIEGPAQL